MSIALRLHNKDVFLGYPFNEKTHFSNRTHFTVLIRLDIVVGRSNIDTRA